MSASFAPRASLIPSQVHTNVVPGAYFEDIIEVTADNSYPAGGYAFGNTQLQTLYGGAYSTLVSVDVVNDWLNPAGPTSYAAVWNKATGKLMAQSQAVAGAANSNVDVTATTDLHLFTASVRIRFF
jgi:hypothetical protein